MIKLMMVAFLVGALAAVATYRLVTRPSTDRRAVPVPGTADSLF
jgi:branched-subunit amino acid ABC-type transport system permease component